MYCASWGLWDCRARHSHNGVGVQEAEAARNVEGHPPPLLHPDAHAAALPLQRPPQVAALHVLHHQHRPVPTHARPLTTRFVLPKVFVLLSSSSHSRTPPDNQNLLCSFTQRICYTLVPSHSRTPLDNQLLFYLFTQGICLTIVRCLALGKKKLDHQHSAGSHLQAPPDNQLLLRSSVQRICCTPLPCTEKRTPGALKRSGRSAFSTLGDPS